MKIARVALPVAVNHLFDYRIESDQKVVPGTIIRVRLGKRTCDGLALEIVSHSAFAAEKIQVIEKVHDVLPLSADILELIRFVSDYYQADIGMAGSLALPPVSVRAALPLFPLCMTERGREALTTIKKKLGRRSATQLQSLLQDVFQDIVSVAQQNAWSAPQRKYIRMWQKNGWLSAADEIVPGTKTPLFDEQSAAVDAILAAGGHFRPFLLQGITGSGKTEVYLSLAQTLMQQGKQVLVLLPEIHLTPQFLQRVENFLPAHKIAVLHSGLADGERLGNWQRAACGEAQLVLGTRLSVFTPLPTLGLIVVDEEHDPSFKQQDGVRYHARDLAVWRAQQRNIPIVLGSATPSLETYRHAQENRYRHLRISRRANAQAKLPTIRFAANRNIDTHEGIAPELWAAMKTCLMQKEQILIFVNRRGFSPSLKCHQCGWEAQCPHCSVRMVLHKAPLKLCCHQCNHTVHVPKECPNCGNLDLAPLGFGTQRLEAALTEAFPKARIARVDRDSTQRRGTFGALREQITAQEIDILIGTQMLAKGHDFPRITLVGVLGADNALYSADFRASERLSALLHQVAGRAGRAAKAGEVIIQTDFPQHPLYETLRCHDFDGFARMLLDERKSVGLPPFASLAVLAAEDRSEEKVASFLREAHRLALTLVVPHRHVQIFSPVPAALARRAGYFRMQMIVRSEKKRGLQKFLTVWKNALNDKHVPKIRWAIDVDPASV